MKIIFEAVVVVIFRFLTRKSARWSEKFLILDVLVDRIDALLSIAHSVESLNSVVIAASLNTAFGSLHEHSVEAPNSVMIAASLNTKLGSLQYAD